MSVIEIWGSTVACMHACMYVERMDGSKAVKRHNAQYDLFNRLHSIAADQGFVKQVAAGWYKGRFEVVRMSLLMQGVLKSR